MEPKFMYREAFTILGLLERYEHDKEDPEGIWQRFMEHIDAIQPHSTDGAFYGAYFGVADDPEALDWLAGMAVSGVAEAPAGLTLRTIPASRYAVFECTVATIHDTYEWVFREWLKTAPCARPPAGSPKADFERYPPGTDSQGTPVLVHIALGGLEGESMTGAETTDRSVP